MTGSELITAAKLIKTAYDLYEWVRESVNPEPGMMWELRSRINMLESEIVRISRELENITYEVRRSDAINITRAVDGQRALYTAAIVYSIDHPGDTAGEIPALAASMALSLPSYYTFPGRTAGSPDRFDPRATLPSFLNAVSTWLAIRQMNSSVWTTNSRDSLSQLADSLESHIRRIEGSVSCVETIGTYFDIPTPPRIPDLIIIPSPDPDPPPEPPTFEQRCRHQIVCMDSMTESGETIFYEDRPGPCEVDGTTFDEQNQTSYLERNYLPARLRDIAQSWRILATS